MSLLSTKTRTICNPSNSSLTGWQISLLLTKTMTLKLYCTKLSNNYTKSKIQFSTWIMNNLTCISQSAKNNIPKYILGLKRPFFVNTKVIVPSKSNTHGSTKPTTSSVHKFHLLPRKLQTTRTRTLEQNRTITTINGDFKFSSYMSQARWQLWRRNSNLLKKK